MNGHKLAEPALALSLAMLLAACAPYAEVGGRTYLGFTIVSIRDAPPPPRVVIEGGVDSWDQVPGSSVYIVRNDADCDVFQYSGGYYLYASGCWYRSSRADRDFAAIDVRSVPRAVLDVPDDHWRHRPHGRVRGWGRDDEPSTYQH